MKNPIFLPFLIYLFLTPILFGQSNNYESVGQCVLQIMKERKLSGNKMFEIVQEECKRLLKDSDDKLKGEWKSFVVGKYKGEFRDGKPWGFGTMIFRNGDKYIGEWEEFKMSGQGKFYYKVKN